MFAGFLIVNVSFTRFFEIVCCITIFAAIFFCGVQRPRPIDDNEPDFEEKEGLDTEVFQDIPKREI